MPHLGVGQLDNMISVFTLCDLRLTTFSSCDS